MRKKCRLLLRVAATIIVLWIILELTTTSTSRSTLQHENSSESGKNILDKPTFQTKLVKAAEEPTPIEKIMLIMKPILYQNEEDKRKSARYWPDLVAVNNPGKQKKILYYNDFWETDDFNIGEGSDIFQEMGCPFSNCFATHDRNLVKPEEADAVIWHYISKRKDKSLPAVRSPHTRLVFFVTEPVPHANPYHINDEQYRNVFNYTMTIFRSSDIYDPYGLIIKLDQPLNLKRAKNMADGKTNMAVSFISHCETQGKRETLVHEIQKYIQVDVYGKCGKFKCPRDIVRNMNSDNCKKMIEKKYKFYFAFENSLCSEYISEKFFNGMSQDIIPVVYGIGNYEEIAPPHSYINILSFKNVKSAADHMIYLSNNDTAYNEYFWWKDYYKVVSDFRRKKSPEYKDISWCSLCKKLHTDTQVKSYSFMKPFSSLKTCYDPNNNIIQEFLKDHDSIKA